MPRPAHRRTYETDAIRVHWDSARCIHTGICLRTLPQAFDVRRRPWVDIHAADADAVADAVSRCPTGALRYERLDGASGDEPDRPTLVVPIPDGPLMLRGDLDIRDADGEQISRENRVTLCRCGRSRNQPFCDNTHLVAGFRSGPANAPESDLPAPERADHNEPTLVKARHDASLDLRGALRIMDADGTLIAETSRALLCRCGHSRNKPFCDGSHEKAGFRSQPSETAHERLEAESPAAFTPNRQVPDPEQLES